MCVCVCVHGVYACFKGGGGWVGVLVSVCFLSGIGLQFTDRSEKSNIWSAKETSGACPCQNISGYIPQINRQTDRHVRNLTNKQTKQHSLLNMKYCQCTIETKMNF